MAYFKLQLSETCIITVLEGEKKSSKKTKEERRSKKREKIERGLEEPTCRLKNSLFTAVAVLEKENCVLSIP